jgi:hypothetical protein
MPPSPSEWLPSDQLVFVLLNLPNALDFSAIMAPALVKDPRGEEGFDPCMQAHCCCWMPTASASSPFAYLARAGVPDRKQPMMRAYLQ